MSVGAVTNNTGIETSTAYQRQKAEKDAAGNGGVSKTDFLKLLTEQLTHQDPLNPAQDIDFTAQLAQLQALDEQMSMTKTMQALRTDTQMQAGTAMIGKYVSGTDKNDSQATGLVSRIVSTSEGVFCELANKQQIPVENINNVWNDANSMNADLSDSGFAIGMWVEAGYDEAYQPIQGIVQSIGMSKNGAVILNLYGGKSVTWDKVTGMRVPTETEMALYGLKDSVREQLEKAMGMVNMTVTGKDKDGKAVTGVVGGSGLSDDQKNVFVQVIQDGEVKLIEFGSIIGEPSKTTNAALLEDYNGLWVGGYDEAGNDVAGIVVGLEEKTSGPAFILDTGQRLYLDAADTRETATDESRARLHGLYAEGRNADGEEVSGFIVKKLMAGDDMAVQLSTGETVLCRNLTLLRDPTQDEENASKAAVDAAKEDGGSDVVEEPEA